MFFLFRLAILKSESKVQTNIRLWKDILRVWLMPHELTVKSEIISDFFFQNILQLLHSLKASSNYKISENLILIGSLNRSELEI